MRYETTAAYISGGICGHLWMPEAIAGYPHRFDVRGRIARFSDPRGVTFRDVLLHELMENGGDFRDARYTADTVLRVERRRMDAAGRYRVHVKEIEVAKLRDCDDLIHADTYTGDFMG